MRDIERLRKIEKQKVEERRLKEETRRLKEEPGTKIKRR